MEAGASAAGRGTPGNLLVPVDSCLLEERSMSHFDLVRNLKLISMWNLKGLE